MGVPRRRRAGGSTGLREMRLGGVPGRWKRSLGTAGSASLLVFLVTRFVLNSGTAPWIVSARPEPPLPSLGAGGEKNPRLCRAQSC